MNESYWEYIVRTELPERARIEFEKPEDEKYKRGKDVEDNHGRNSKFSRLGKTRTASC